MAVRRTQATKRWPSRQDQDELMRLREALPETGATAAHPAAQSIVDVLLRCGADGALQVARAVAEGDFTRFEKFCFDIFADGPAAVKRHEAHERFGWWGCERHEGLCDARRDSHGFDTHGCHPNHRDREAVQESS
jgi:hypothetical protein